MFTVATVCVRLVKVWKEKTKDRRRNNENTLTSLLLEKSLFIALRASLLANEDVVALAFDETAGLCWAG